VGDLQAPVLCAAQATVFDSDHGLDTPP